MVLTLLEDLGMNPDDVSIWFLIDHNDNDNGGVETAVDVYWVNRLMRLAMQRFREN